MRFVSAWFITTSFLCLAGFHTYALGGLTIGQPAPEFTLKDLNGKAHALKDARGQIAVIAFLSARCPISNAYNERIRALAEDYAKQNVAFFAINASADEDVAEIKAHA
jgi:peroxiredoxin